MSEANTIREARLAIDRALGQGHLVQLTSAQLDDAAAAVVARLNLHTATAFPVPGENFIDRTGKVRGVTKVDAGSDGTIHVSYIEGAPEYYYPSAVIGWYNQDQQAVDEIFTADEIRQRLQTELENYWGTAWGEAEMTAYLNIVDLVLDPESTQRHRITVKERK